MVTQQTTPADPALKKYFNELVASWKRAAQGASNSEVILAHPAYLEILAMGPPAVPLILRDFERKGWHWYAALHQLTGARPYPSGTRGRERMRQAWLAWGRESGLL